MSQKNSQTMAESQSTSVVVIGGSQQRSQNESDVGCTTTSQSRKFVDPDYPSNFSEQLLASFHSGLFSDVEIKCKGKSFKLHKNILAMTCPYFRTMFTSNFKERSASVITLDDFDSDGLHDIFLYLYTGSLIATEKNVIEVAKIADMFELLSLHEFCCIYLVRRISYDNCLGFMQLGRSINSVKLEKASSRFALKNFEGVALVDEFLELNKEDLGNYIKQPALKIEKEEDVLPHVFRWLLHMPESRTLVFREVLCNLHLLDIDISLIKYHISKTSCVRNNPELKLLVNELQDHFIMKSPIPEDLQVLNPRIQTKSSGGILFFLEIKKPGDPGSVLPFHVFMSHSDSVNLKTTNLTGAFHSVKTILQPGVASCVVGPSTVYVCGLGSQRDQLYRYEVNVTRWQVCSSMPHGRIDHCFVAGNSNKLYVVGGQILVNDTYKTAKDILEYDLVTNCWKSIGKLETGVVQGGALFVSGDIYVIGGLTNATEGDGTGTVNDCIQIFSTFTRECTVLKTKLPLSAPIKKVFFPRDKIVILSENSIVGVDFDALLEREYDENASESTLDCTSFPHDFGSKFTCEMLGRRLVVITRKGLLCAVKWERLFEENTTALSADVLRRITHDPDLLLCCDAVQVDLHMSQAPPVVCHDNDSADSLNRSAIFISPR